MSIICPTVLAEESHAYREQMERIEPFAERIQIDLKDDKFALGECVNLDQIWWPARVKADLHLMYQNPDEYLQKIIELKPNLVIVHAESNSDIPKLAAKLRAEGIKTGIAVLQSTQIADVAYLFPHVQHLLIFSGNLGHFGGQADLTLTSKISQAKAISKYLEIGWDGGANFENCQQLVLAGVDVINVGGAIQKAENPQESYKLLTKIINQ